MRYFGFSTLEKASTDRLDQQRIDRTDDAEHKHHSSQRSNDLAKTQVRAPFA
jgi:hypothetical protein